MPGEETKAPPESETPNNAGPEDPTEPRAPVEEYTVTKAWTEMSTKIKILNVFEMKEICSRTTRCEPNCQATKGPATCRTKPSQAGLWSRTMLRNKP